MNFVQVAVQSRKVNLVSVDRAAHDGASTYELNVDSKLQEFTISVSGEQPNVTVIDPSGFLLEHISSFWKTFSNTFSMFYI